MALANEKIKNQRGNVGAKKFSLAYTEAKRRCAAIIINADRDDPQNQITFERGTKAWSHTDKWVGAPKVKWATEAMKLIRKEIREAHSSPRRTQEYNPESPGQERNIRAATSTEIYKWYSRVAR